MKIIYLAATLFIFSTNIANAQEHKYFKNINFVTDKNGNHKMTLIIKGNHMFRHLAYCRELLYVENAQGPMYDLKYLIPFEKDKTENIIHISIEEYQPLTKYQWYLVCEGT